MYEVVAVLVGVVIGASLAHRSRRVFLLGTVPLCIATGLAVSAASGELELSAGFLIFDVGQTLIAAVLTAVALNAVRDRSWSSGRRRSS